MKNFFEVTVKCIRETEISTLYWTDQKQEGPTCLLGARWPFPGTARPLKSRSAGSRTRSLGQREARKPGGESRELGGRLDPTETLTLPPALRFLYFRGRLPCLRPRPPAAALSSSQSERPLKNERISFLTAIHSHGSESRKCPGPPCTPVPQLPGSRPPRGCRCQRSLQRTSF